MVWAPSQQSFESLPCITERFIRPLGKSSNGRFFTNESRRRKEPCNEFFLHLFLSVEAFVWMWWEPCLCLTCQGEWESSEVDSFSIFLKSSHGTAQLHVGRQMCVWILMIHSSKRVWANQSQQFWLQLHNLVAKRRNDYVVVMIWSLLISIVTKSPPQWSISFSSSINNVIYYKWLFSWRIISRRSLTQWFSGFLFLFFFPILPFSPSNF